MLTTKVTDTHICTSNVQHAYFLGTYTYSVAKMSHFNKKCNALIFLGIDKIRKIEYNYPITRLHLTIHLNVLVKIKEHLNITLKW